MDNTLIMLVIIIRRTSYFYSKYEYLTARPLLPLVCPVPTNLQKPARLRDVGCRARVTRLQFELNDAEQSTVVFKILEVRRTKTQTTNRISETRMRGAPQTIKLSKLRILSHQSSNMLVTNHATRVRGAANPLRHYRARLSQQHHRERGLVAATG